jgi:hypothetical protein
MGKRFEWHTPLTPGEIRDVLHEVTDTEGGVPMFKPRLLFWTANQPGYLPLLGTFNLSHFQVQIQPQSSDPFATFCTAAVKAVEGGSRITGSFAFYGFAKFVYVLVCGWILFLSVFALDDDPAPVQRILAAAVILALSAALALFARWRASRDMPALEEFLTRKLLARAQAPREVTRSAAPR